VRDFKKSSTPGVAEESDLMKCSFCSNFIFQKPLGCLDSVHVALGMCVWAMQSSPQHPKVGCVTLYGRLREQWF